MPSNSRRIQAGTAARGLERLLQLLLLHPIQVAWAPPRPILEPAAHPPHPEVAVPTWCTGIHCDARRANGEVAPKHQVWM